MPDARVRLEAEQHGDGDRAGHADPAQVIADQVDDHHVLRAVLRRRLKPGALHGSPGGVGGAPRGALDRLGGDSARPGWGMGAAQEQLGRQGRDGGPGGAGGGHADEGGVGRVELGHAAAERVERVAGEVRLGAQRDVGLEDVTLAYVLHRPADRRLMPFGPGHQAERAERVVARALRPRRGPAGQLGEPPIERVRAVRRAQRLEVPLPRCPQPAQHVVVIAEPPGRQGPWARRRQRLAARAVPEVTDPPAAEHAAPAGRGAGGRVDRARPVRLARLARLAGGTGRIASSRRPGRVEHVMKRSWRGPDQHGLRGDQVAAAGPGSAERHGMRVLPDQAQHVRRGELPAQRAAYQAEPVVGRHSSRLSAPLGARAGRGDKSGDVTSARAPVRLRMTPRGGELTPRRWLRQPYAYTRIVAPTIGAACR